jgi:type IV secretory pathway TraG/TraD family ATPase VirD4
MNQARIRPPFPIYRILAAVFMPLILIVAIKVAILDFGPTQTMFWHEYLKVSLVPHIDRKSFGRPQVLVDEVKVAREELKAKLQTRVYGDRTPFQIVRFPLSVGIIICCFLFGWGWVLDQDRLVKFRTVPRNIRGTKLATIDEFQKTIKDPGLGIWVEEPRRWYQRKRGEVKFLQVSESVETQHLQTIGDSGSGKTLALLSILDQAEIKGDVCVVLDQHLQFVPLYYRPERGDIILNPTDERCAYWTPADEIDYRTTNSANATAQAQAAGIYPGSETDSNKNHWFFIDCARRIWTHIMTLYNKPNAQDMANLMEHLDPLIDAVSKGTSLEGMLKKNADGQRAAIESVLTQILSALKQLPKKDDKRPVFAAREWVKERKGWIFITSSLNTRTSLAPLQRLWINSLIQELLSQGMQKNLPKVRMVLDELPTIGELGMLPIAYAEGRKAGLTLIVAFQGRSGIRAIYGERAEGIFSAAFSQLILRTKDSDAAEWVSKLLGEFEAERLNEHVSPDGKRSYTAARMVERVVLAAQVAGLAPRIGYFRYENFTVPVTVAIAKWRPPIAEAFIPCAGAAPEMLSLPNLEALLAEEEAERTAIANATREAIFDPEKMTELEKKKAKPRGNGSQGGLYGVGSH